MAKENVTEGKSSNTSDPDDQTLEQQSISKDEEEEFDDAWEESKKVALENENDDDDASENDDDDASENDDLKNINSSPDERINPEEYMDYFTEELKGAEISLPDGENVNMSEFMSDYPEVGNVIIYVAQHIANKLIDGAIASGEIAAGKDVMEIKSSFTQKAFDQAMTEENSDWQNIINNKKFTEWLKKQPGKIQEMVNSDDPADGVYLIRQYQITESPEDRENRKKLKNEKREKKRKKNALHKGALKDKGAPGFFGKSRTHKGDLEEFDEIWEESKKNN